MASGLISMYLKHMDVRKRKGILRRTLQFLVKVPEK